VWVRDAGMGCSPAIEGDGTVICRRVADLFMIARPAGGLMHSWCAGTALVATVGGKTTAAEIRVQNEGAARRW
jgi:hypothetical protein